MPSDPEYIDEMERRGDSLLDEEEWRSNPELCSVCGQPDNCGDCDHTLIDWTVFVEDFGGTLKLRVTVIDGYPLALDSARNLANAILSEIEIVQREERGDW